MRACTDFFLLPALLVLQGRITLLFFVLLTGVRVYLTDRRMDGAL